MLWVATDCGVPANDGPAGTWRVANLESAPFLRRDLCRVVNAKSKDEPQPGGSVDDWRQRVGQ